RARRRTRCGGDAPQTLLGAAYAQGHAGALRPQWRGRAGGGRAESRGAPGRRKARGHCGLKGRHRDRVAIVPGLFWRFAGTHLKISRLPPPFQNPMTIPRAVRTTLTLHQERTTMVALPQKPSWAPPCQGAWTL